MHSVSHLHPRTYTAFLIRRLSRGDVPDPCWWCIQSGLRRGKVTILICNSLIDMMGHIARCWSVCRDRHILCRSGQPFAYHQATIYHGSSKALHGRGVLTCNIISYGGQWKAVNHVATLGTFDFT